MNIIPAIDLLNGTCVRLLRGDYDAVTEYSSDPRSVGVQFAGLAVEDLHIVDLDGARAGVQSNQSIVETLVRSSGLKVQLGGGIRRASDIDRWLASGVKRCVLGSVAVEDPAMVTNWIKHFGADKLVLALDVRIDQGGLPRLATQGWTETSDASLWDCLGRYVSEGARHVLCTDISRDGALQGPNLELYADILARFPGLQLQASGGVRNMLDLHRLRRLGLPAAITGKALLDGRISASEVATFRRSA